MSEGNTRTELYEKIMMMLLNNGVNTDHIKHKLYMILDEFEISQRTTEITLLKKDRNDYLLKKFIISKTVKGCTERTIYYYGKTVKSVLEKIGKTVDDITADDIRLYLALRQARDGVTETTADNELRCLRSFFAYLRLEEILEKDVTEKIPRIKAEKKIRKAFTDMEIESIRKFAKDEREKAIIEILLSTGCRVSELVQIKMEDIENDTIVVHGKGKKDRKCYLNAKAIICLHDYMNLRNDINPYLFPKGVPITENNRHDLYKSKWWTCKDLVQEGHVDKSSIEAIVRRIGARAGITECHPHKFRRTCATSALKRGMPIEQVSKMLGHEQIGTTMIYLSITDEELYNSHKKYVI